MSLQTRAMQITFDRPTWLTVNTPSHTQGQKVGSGLYSNRFASRACAFCERANVVRTLIYTELGHLVHAAVVICQLNSCYSMLKKRFLQQHVAIITDLHRVLRVSRYLGADRALKSSRLEVCHYRKTLIRLLCVQRYATRKASPVLGFLFFFLSPGKVWFVFWIGWGTI